MKFDSVEIRGGVLVLMQNGVEVGAYLPQMRRKPPFTTDRGPLKVASTDFGMRHLKGSLLTKEEKAEEQYQIENGIA